MTAEQKVERDFRTVFVGNVAHDCTLKQLKKLFKSIGQVESVRFRSICTVQDSKKSERAKIITKEINETQKDNKNAYVLFAEKESVEKAIEKLNSSEF